MPKKSKTKRPARALSQVAIDRRLRTTQRALTQLIERVQQLEVEIAVLKGEPVT